MAKLVAINFGDNDFHSTFQAVMEHLRAAHAYTGVELARDELLAVINRLSPVCYLTHQWTRQRDFTRLEANEGFRNTSDYLQIGPSQLLLDGEVAMYLEDAQQHNGECTVWDLHHDYVYTV